MTNRNYVAAPLEAADNTKDGHRSAVKLYNDKFAPANNFLPFRQLSVDYLLAVDEDGRLRLFDMFRRWGKFLSQKVSDRTESGYYSAGTATQIFSNLKNALDLKLNGLCSHLKEPNDVWCDQLYHQLRRKCAKQAAERGEQVSDSADAIWRTILIAICSYLVSAAFSMGYFWRIVFITLYLVIGRAGESATATWDSMKWNTTLLCPELAWNEIKTGKTCPVTLFCDAKNWEICWWHAMFCYLMSDGAGAYGVAGGQVPDGADFLFPYLQNVTDGDVASKVTKILHQLARLELIPGLTKKHSSHGFKAGAADDASINRFCTIVAIVSRANWDYSGQVSKLK